MGALLDSTDICKFTPSFGLSVLHGALMDCFLMKKLQHREAGKHVQDHTARRWQSQGQTLDPISSVTTGILMLPHSVHTWEGVARQLPR